MTKLQQNNKSEGNVLLQFFLWSVRMKTFNNLSIQKKLLIAMVGISLFIITVITGITMGNSYKTMQEQTIYNRRMSVGWLRDRLELILSGYQEQFYEFEVNQNYKKAIQLWCIQNESLDYESSWQLITAMNEIISMDSNLNSMEIYNLKTKEVLVAERSGAKLEQNGDCIAEWENRQQDMQTNLVFLRTEKEILIFHQMNRFTDKEPYALIVMHIRPYELQDILADIKMTPDETILILNDEKQLIEADYGRFSEVDVANAQSILEHMTEDDKTEVISEGNYYFYRKVSGEKLQILLSVPDYTIRNTLKGTLWAALLTGLIVTAISLGGSILFSRLFSKPVIQLSETMRHFTLDDYQRQDILGKQRKEKTGENEIAILQDSFQIMVERNQRLIAQEYQREVETREAQVHALQAQINPHFMYNIMQVIGGMALNRNAPEIYRVTTALGDLMRYCLNFSKETVPLREEIHYLQSYCMLQNERFDERIELRVMVEDDIQDCIIPKLILQPILENSFHHGLVNKPGKWILTVLGGILQDKEGRKILELTVQDNGAGIQRDSLKEIQNNLRRDAKYALKSDAHIGLANVDARIRLMYPDGDYGITIDSAEGEGTTVTIRMEAQREHEKV